MLLQCLFVFGEFLIEINKEGTATKNLEDKPMAITQMLKQASLQNLLRDLMSCNIHFQQSFLVSSPLLTSCYPFLLLKILH